MGNLKNNNHKLLSKKEIYDLLSPAKAGDIDAINKIIDNYTRLTDHIAMKAYNLKITTMDFDDMKNIGRIAILTAIEKFDMTTNNSFSTFLYPVVKNSISMEFRKMNDDNASLEAEIGEKGSGINLKNLLDNKDVLSIEEQCENMEISDNIKKCIDKLSSREQQILYLRYWKQYTLVEIGDMFNVSRQRIEQLEKRATNKLKIKILKKYKKEELM